MVWMLQRDENGFIPEVALPFSDTPSQNSHDFSCIKWAGFTRLSSMPHLTGLGFWRLMQLSHFLHSLPKASAHTRQLTEFEEDFPQTSTYRHMISCMYAALMTSNSTAPLLLWAKWEAGLGCTVTVEERGKIILSMCKIPRVRLQVFNEMV